MIPPQNPEENILYIGHYGFKTILNPTVIIFHPDLNKHELSSFEIRTRGCHTHISSDPYEIEEHISEDVYDWMEDNRVTLSGDFDFSIREWNEELWFDKEGELVSGLKILCPGTLGPEYEEPWINIYDQAHFAGKDFSIEILEITEDKHKIRLKIEGEFEKYPTLFIGWFPVEYINPNIWIDDFFKDLNENSKELARLKEIHANDSGNIYRNFSNGIYERYFSRNLIEKSPYWEKFNENYNECIIGVANIYGFDAKLKSREVGQDVWAFSKKLIVE
ncbi:hypothetical protein FUAX_45030 (plasmid) [Fulvitalea axinellae]|uniref:Uncharacterized protein n=2 Tax=Fulvitalea axinellae TaxID=1182444 RepID=A0AAU9DG17_9BACT|nr:hypothetical protein FUAX_45030 [Fulvitalea axinellae]